jgi:dihydrofolate synthase/folylpolyglutamate synthase
MLAAIFQKAGYRTGLYTSPHLKDFRERIKVNGKMVSKEYVTRFVERMKQASEKIEPSFFEFTVVMALSYFEEEKTDIAIIETGLGGRLDSTNVITPVLSIITNIGLDHVNILGDTLEKIAFEKAGIIKQNIPVVIGETLPATRNIFLSKAHECNAPIIFAERSYSITKASLKNKLLEIELKNFETDEHSTYDLDLTGIYQQNNLRTVLTAINLLKDIGYDIGQEDLKIALSTTKKLTGLHGRWEIIHTDPQVILDVAHNEDGIRQILKQLSLTTYNQLHIIFGIVKDKDAGKVLSLLPKDASYYFTNAQIPRALPAGELREIAKKYDLKGEQYPDVNIALHAALDKAADTDLILVCGSVFLVGEIELAAEKNISG